MNSACKLVGYYRVAAYGLRYDPTSPVAIDFWLKYAQIDLVRKMIKLKGLFCGTNMVLQKKKDNFLWFNGRAPSHRPMLLH